MLADAILIVAVRLGKMRGVHPVASPAFAVARGSQQPIDEAFVRAGTLVGDKAFGFVRRRRQTDQIEVRAADERVTIGARRLDQLAVIQLGDYEVVDRVGNSRRR
jgi:hypothetical protein